MPFNLEDLSKIDTNLLKLLTQHLPDMMWIKDINNNYIYVNQAICDGLLMAKDIDEPIGKNDMFFALREREAHKDNPYWHTFGELCFNSDKVVIDENRAIKSEEYGNVKGKLLYLEVNKAPFYDKDGNIIGTVGSGRDITELKKIQLKLTQQAKIIEQIHDCIITTNMDGSIISWNKSAQKLFQYSSNEVIDKNIDIIFTEKSNLIMNQNITELLKNEECNIKIDFTTKLDELLLCDLTLSLLKDENNENIRIIYYIKDITYKEKLNEEIIKQEKIIINQAHHVAMGEMIGNIAHQWRQPLSIISSGATGIQLQHEYGTLTDEFLNETCELIDSNAQYLSNTIDDFRNFIKGDSKIVNFNLKNDTDAFLKLIDSTIKNHHINIVLDLEEHINIKGYPNELIQCFINIFNNAKDAIVDNNVQEDRYIFISQEIMGNNAIIKIRDNAGGIPKNILPKIFDPYFTTKHQSIGTGLGLHMTYNLVVDGMGGTIEADNVKYKFNEIEYIGAEFVILLPIN